jgi:hypothetical protein
VSIEPVTPIRRLGSKAVDEDALRTIDLRALLELDLPPPDFVVEHLFPRRSLVLMSGDSGAGKTALIVHAGIAIVLEKPIGNRFEPVAGAKVLYVNAESDPSLISLSVKQALAGLDATAEALPWNRWEFVGDQGFADVCLTPGAAGDADKRRFEKKIATFRPDVIVFDTHRAIFQVDDRDNIQVSIGLNWLKILAIKFNCCIVVVHHQKKLSAGSNSTRERITGAAAFREIPGVVLSAVSDNGCPMTALNIDKTRFARDDVQTGKAFPVEATFEPPRRQPDGTYSVGSSAFAILAITEQAPEQTPGEARENRSATHLVAIKAKLIHWAKQRSADQPFTKMMLEDPKSGLRAQAADVRKALDELIADGEIAVIAERPSRRGGNLHHLAELADFPDDN